MLDYNSTQTPENYICAECGATGVRLYRRYQTMLSEQTLLCTRHALEDQKKDKTDNESAHSIGWLVAAVPTVENDTYWGYISVPDAGVNWWNNLPVIK